MVAKKLVTVVGATGAQGGSVVDYLLKNKSQEYAIRAVTRSTESEAAKALAARGVEVVRADLTDIAVSPDYESKAQVTRYIQSKPELLAKTTLVWCAYYATNFAGLSRPIYVPATGQYIQIQATPSDQPIACIGNTRSNFGIFVEAALAQPDKTRGGQTVFAFVESTTLGGLLQTWAEAHNVKATYIQVSRGTLFSSWPMEVQEFTTVGI